VREEEAVAVRDDLGVAPIGLELEPQPAPLGDPEPPGGAGEQRAGVLTEERAVDKLARELDPRADADRCLGGQRAAYRARERGARRRWAARSDGVRCGHADKQDGQDSRAEDE